MTSDWPDFNDMWNYGDPEGTEAKFRELLPDAEKGNDRSYHLQLLTQIARTLGLQSKFEEAHRVLDQVEASMDSGDIVEIRYLLERGRTYNSSKQADQAVSLFKKAVDIAEELQADFYMVDALHMLGIAAQVEDRLEWNRKAIAYAEGSDQERARGWMGSLLNNTGWTLFDEEDYPEALELFEKAQAFREEQGNAGNIRIAKWCVAKTLRMLERTEEGLAMQRELEADPEHDVFVEEEIAECLYAMGKSKEAKPYFKKAYAGLSQISWVAEDKARMERLKSLAE